MRILSPFKKYCLSIVLIVLFMPLSNYAGNADATWGHIMQLVYSLNKYENTKKLIESENPLNLTEIGHSLWQSNIEGQTKLIQQTLQALLQNYITQLNAAHPEIPFTEEILNEIDELIKNGADINTKDENGDTLVHAAVKQSNLNALIWLIKRNAKVNLSNQLNETPLCIAATFRNSEILLTLLKKLSNQITYLTWVDLFSNLLTVCDKSSNPLQIDKTILEIAKIIFENASSIMHSQNDKGNTLFHIAVIQKNLEAFQWLIKQTASASIYMNMKNKEGQTPLYIAARSNNPDILLQALAASNYLNEEILKTLFWEAANANLITNVLILIQNGAKSMLLEKQILKLLDQDVNPLILLYIIKNDHIFLSNLAKAINNNSHLLAYNKFIEIMSGFLFTPEPWLTILDNAIISDEIKTRPELMSFFRTQFTERIQGLVEFEFIKYILKVKKQNMNHENQELLKISNKD